MSWIRLLSSLQKISSKGVEDLSEGHIILGGVPSSKGGLRGIVCSFGIYHGCYGTPNYGILHGF